jgi:hypothetical protein
MRVERVFQGRLFNGQPEVGLKIDELLKREASL